MVVASAQVIETLSADVVGQLAAIATPSAVAAGPGHDQRSWIVRLAGVGEIAGHTEALGVQMTTAARDAVRDACRARGVNPDADEAMPLVRVHVIGPFHLVVNVTTVEAERDPAHAYLVAASAALRTLEESHPVDDIQGFPRRLWKLLLGPESGAAETWRQAGRTPPEGPRASAGQASLVRLIFEHGDDARDTYEAELRGYRSHVWAELDDGSVHPLTFYDMTRLAQSLESECATGHDFFAEPGLVVVPAVTRLNMENAAKALASEGFFAPRSPAPQLATMLPEQQSRPNS